MKTYNFLIIFGVLFFVSFIITSFDNTFNHELTHKQIAVYSGCQSYMMDVNIFTDSSFTCLKYKNNVSNNPHVEEMLHGYNEVITYNMKSLISSIFICTFLLLIGLILFFNKMFG